MSNAFPRILRVQQNFPASPPLDLAATLTREFEKARPQIKPRARIAVAVGSRGITNLSRIVSSVLEVLRGAGAEPFIVPAMGSHGGATPEGQTEILGTYGITETAMKTPIRASMETRQLSVTEEGAPVFCSQEALSADGIVLINRIKPHTDFSGTLGSGLLKMCVIGLGKRDGAAAMHAAASRLGYERAIRSMARAILRQAPIICGVGLIENQYHETVKIAVLPREQIESAENQLFLESRDLMPKLPFEEIDLLIVDFLGKNISGAGMDPNVTGRWVHGYSSSLMRDGHPAPFVRRIFVRDLTPETHGNAVGIGLADITTSRVVQAMDRRVTCLNSLTALTPQCAKIPIHFDTDREAIERALASLALSDVRSARVVRIRDTLSLGDLEVSEGLAGEVKLQANLKALNGAEEFRFDKEGNLLPIARS
jgi:hypothetical protein